MATEICSARSCEIGTALAQTWHSAEREILVVGYPPITIVAVIDSLFQFARSMLTRCREEEILDGHDESVLEYANLFMVSCVALAFLHEYVSADGYRSVRR